MKRSPKTARPRTAPFLAAVIAPLALGFAGCNAGRETTPQEPLVIEITAEGPVDSPGSERTTSGQEETATEEAKLPSKTP